jgi:hypothetical protein
MQTFAHVPHPKRHIGNAGEILIFIPVKNVGERVEKSGE